MSGLQPMPQGGNLEAIYLQFLKEIKDLGEIKGRGQNAQIQAAVSCVEKSRDGVADPSKAEEIYNSFLGGEAQAGAGSGTAHDVVELASKKQRTSDLRQFLKLGQIKTIDPVKVINDAVVLVRDTKAMGKEIIPPKKKVFDCLVDIARAQSRIPEHELTPDEMIAACQKKGGREKEEADLLASHRKGLEKIAERFERSDEVQAAVQSLTERIDALGGTSADRRAAQKARDELERLQGGKVKGRKVKRK